MLSAAIDHAVVEVGEEDILDVSVSVSFTSSQNVSILIFIESVAIVRWGYHLRIRLFVNGKGWGE